MMFVNIAFQFGIDWAKGMPNSVYEELLGNSCVIWKGQLLVSTDNSGIFGLLGELPLLNGTAKENLDVVMGNPEVTIAKEVRAKIHEILKRT